MVVVARGAVALATSMGIGRLVLTPTPSTVLYTRVPREPAVAPGIVEVEFSA
jgi:hypothetical protein